ncbi:MFS transporter [Oscillibacter sp. MSJ-2]|uniref:MFS transporter n=1 Tax=Dysosmobacter acutus TaxID=2841504 RepID=A0ABS6FBK3_9FIRM|nr:MFS transporter [Dysosmobacter acutus]MBU5626755.1 MFS transporter [Dysosmobacter acutus]
MKLKIGQNRWLALVAVTLAYSFAFLTRYIWSPVMADAGAEFQLDSVQMGLYMTAFMIGYLFMQLPGGILADRLQPKYLLMGMVCVATVCSAVFASTSSYPAGLIIRAVEGVSCGGIYSSCSKIVSGYFQQKDRAVAMGILLASPPLGILLANSLGEPLNEALGWRATIRIIAYIGIAVTALLALSVRTQDKLGGGVSGRGLLEGAVLYFRDSQQLLLGVGGMLSMFASVGFATWMNTYMKVELGYSGILGGALLTVYSVVGIAATCCSGALVKKFGWDPRRFIIVLFACGALCTILFGMLKGYPALMAVGVVYGIVVNLPSAHLANLCIQRAPEKHIGSMCALENLIFQSGAMLQSYIIGTAADSQGGYHCMWWIFSAACVLSVLFICLFQPKRNIS